MGAGVYVEPGLMKRWTDSCCRQNIESWSRDSDNPIPLLAMAQAGDFLDGKGCLFGEVQNDRLIPGMFWRIQHDQLTSGIRTLFSSSTSW